jgi:hypothetical protein
MVSNKKEDLREEIQKLKQLLRERERALPAHSVRPRHLQEIEDLAARIAELERDLSEISKG